MNLATIIDPHPGDAPAIHSGGRTVTYGELRRLVAGVRGGLAGAGVAPGDRVVLALPNDSSFVAAYLGVLGAGGVAVPVDPSLPAPALSAEMAAVGPAGVIAGEAVAEALAGVDPGVRPDLVVDRSSLEAMAEGPEAAVVDRAGDDLALLVFTSGTAGSPKAAMLTHRNLASNLDQVQHHPGRSLVPADVSYGVLPLFHAFGINVVLGLSLLAGASVLMVDRFDPGDTLRDVPARRVSLLAGAPTLFAALARHEGATGSELASVRMAVSGAAALSSEVAQAFTARFGIPLWQGYGLTEASPVVTSSVIAGVPKPGSIGVPLPGLEVRLVDESGEEALVGDPGELWVHGPNVFPGYWHDPEATSEVLTADGWLRTGDIAVSDDEGFLYLVDRAKDLIIVSGFNVYPAEVEDALVSHPDVAEAAVVGVEDPRTGEAVEAYVVAAAGASPAPEELRRHCGSRLAAYKCPARITVVDRLPRGMGGKLLRRQVPPA